MKKFLSIIFVIFAINLPTLAALTTDEAISETYIQNHGHSNEMSRLIDLQRSQINCTKTTYKSKDPAWYADKKVSFVRRIFMLVDPGLDDGQFMQNNIDYTNRWDDL